MNVSLHRLKQISADHPIIFVVFLTIAFVFVGVLVKISRPQFSNPKLAARPYVWPDGCPAKRYTWKDDIPRACRDDRYAIPLRITEDHGFDPGNKSDGRFHRVGNDAIAFVCPVLIDTCRIGRIYYDVFVTESK